MDIFQVELDDGEVAAAVELSMEPYGTKTPYAADNTERSRIMLHQIGEIWPRLWLEMRTHFETAAKELDLDTPLDSDSLIGQISGLGPGVFMADRCDTYLSLSSENHPPDWDCFLKDGQIVHFQPVY